MRGVWVAAAGAMVAVSCLFALFASGVLSTEANRGSGRTVYERARDLLDDGRIAEAKAAYQVLHAQEPRDIRAMRGLAMCAREEADDEEAIRWWEQLLPLLTDDDEKSLTWRHLAMAHHRLGNEREALVAAQSALTLSKGADPSLHDLMTKLLTASSGVHARQQPSGRQAGLPPSPTPRPPDPLDMLPRKRP